MTVSLTVTRAELGLGDLDVSVSPYRVGGDSQDLELGTVTQLYQWARSPYVRGAQLIGVQPDVVQDCTLDIDVVGTTQAEIRTRVQALVGNLETDTLGAFTQWSYTLELTIDGTEWAWTCHPASYRVGVTAGSNLYGLLCPVRLQFPRQPVPVTGPY